LIVIIFSLPGISIPAAMGNEPMQTIQSALSGGNWYKIRIKKTGVYKLTYEDIQSIGISNPAGVRVFGNGGAMLPLMNNQPRTDDLQENPVYMDKGADGIFGPGDFILFYGIGPVTWKFDPATSFFTHQVHAYSAYSYYFIGSGDGEGRRIVPKEPLSATPSITVTSFYDYSFKEKNRKNLIKSGRLWVGEKLENAFDTTFLFPNRLTNEPVKIRAGVVSRSAQSRQFVIRLNGDVAGTLSVGSVNLSNSIGTYANYKSDYFSLVHPETELNVEITYNKTNTTDEGYLDFVAVMAKRSLIYTGSELFFRDPFLKDLYSIASFRVESLTASGQIWDVTNPAAVKQLPATFTGSSLQFTDSTNITREYVALDPGAGFPKPEWNSSLPGLGLVPNQNLHGTGPCQLLIITHPDFVAAADSVAEYHRKHDGFEVAVATTTQVYNEFSSGAPDVSAIRDYARMIYKRFPGTGQLRYLLLFGDGSYNNFSQDKGNSNYILTYQSESSLNATSSYVSDDFFGFMDDNEGGSDNMEIFSLDLGVGRLPAKSANEALVLFEKIRDYDTDKNRTDWRNNIIFVGDDEDGNLHMMQSNSLADWVRNTYPQFNVKKVLLDAYKQVSASNGSRYPDVNRIIANNINKGVLIFNYTGHGGERGIAAEQILMREDLLKLSNSNNLPLFVTATCEFSRFDDLTDDEGKLIESTSAGETSLLFSQGGSIALLSTTRIVYSDRNHYLNTKFYRIVFQRDENGKPYRLGDIIRMTKDSTGAQRNKLNFILLGNPALRLAQPTYRVVTDSVNGESAEAVSDTLRAFSLIRVSGHVENAEGNLPQDYNGTIYPSVFDKVQNMTTLGNDGGDPMTFQAQENLIYKGKASVKNGQFSFSFMVPRDITYSFGSGKISYYAENGPREANGHFTGFTIGGTAADVPVDENGPEISLFLNDEYFSPNGITNSSPLIYALISDESGINTTGNGIGHDLTGVINGDVSAPVVLNDFFESDLNDFRRGKVIYPLQNLEPGVHSLTLRAWDVFNNSSEAIIVFEVLNANKLVMKNMYNYPNPATNQTWFTFEHNRPGELLEVSVHIFGLDGRMVGNIEKTIEPGGFTSAPMEWDLHDTNGNLLNPGFYPYRIRAIGQDGSVAEQFGKLLISKQ